MRDQRCYFFISSLNISAENFKVPDMNYDGAEGLELGQGNTKLDPSVLKGQLKCLSQS